MKIPRKGGSKVNKAWLHEHINDPYVKLAHREGYRARAAYKLKELDEIFGLIKPGYLMVDLGCTPGAWSQYARRRMSPQGLAVREMNGTIIGLDLLPMESIEGVTFIQGDFREADVLAQLEAALAGRQADVVVSDMAPNLSGIASADAARIENLVELAIEFAQNHMKRQGAMVAKMFHGGSYNDVVKHFKAAFEVVKPHKPKASRDRSSETFLVGMGLRGAPPRVAANPCALRDLQNPASQFNSPLLEAKKRGNRLKDGSMRVLDHKPDAHPCGLGVLPILP